MKSLRIDELVKSLKNRIFVIPVKTGIQDFQTVKIKMDSRLRGNDDFLRVHQALNQAIFDGGFSSHPLRGGEWTEVRGGFKTPPNPLPEGRGD